MWTLTTRLMTERGLYRSSSLPKKTRRKEGLALREPTKNSVQAGNGWKAALRAKRHTEKRQEKGDVGHHAWPGLQRFLIPS